MHIQVNDLVVLVTGILIGVGLVRYGISIGVGLIEDKRRIESEQEYTGVIEDES